MKTLMIIILSTGIGYTASNFNPYYAQIHSCKTGLFVISKGHIYQLLEVTTQKEPDFRDSYKTERVH
jgi:hypothetical protein